MQQVLIVLRFYATRTFLWCYVFAACTVMHKVSRAKGPFHDPVTWYGINYSGTQITHWDFQNRGKWGWTSSVLEAPSIIYFVPCDRILQRAYCETKRTIPVIPREPGWCQEKVLWCCTLFTFFHFFFFQFTFHFLWRRPLFTKMQVMLLFRLEIQPSPASLKLTEGVFDTDRFLEVKFTELKFSLMAFFSPTFSCHSLCFPLLESLNPIRPGEFGQSKFFFLFAEICCATYFKSHVTEK